MISTALYSEEKKLCSKERQFELREWTQEFRVNLMS